MHWHCCDCHIICDFLVLINFMVGCKRSYTVFLYLMRHLWHQPRPWPHSSMASLTYLIITQRIDYLLRLVDGDKMTQRYRRLNEVAVDGLHHVGGVDGSVIRVVTVVRSLYLTYTSSNSPACIRSSFIDISKYSTLLRYLFSMYLSNVFVRLFVSDKGLYNVRLWASLPNLTQ